MMRRFRANAPMLASAMAASVAFALEEQCGRERAGGAAASERVACLTIASQVSLVSGLGIRVEYLSSQSICYPIAEPADVDEHALVGEIGQQAAAVGDSDAGVEGDRFPYPVNVGFGEAVVPEHGRSQIGSLDLEASLTLGVIAESQIVHHSGGEEQLLVVGGIVQAALVIGEQAGEQKASDAVIDDRLTRRRPHDARGWRRRAGRRGG